MATCKTIKYRVVHVDCIDKGHHYELEYYYEYEYNWFEKLFGITVDNEYRPLRDNSYNVIEFKTIAEANKYIEKQVPKRTPVDWFEVQL